MGSYGAFFGCVSLVSINLPSRLTTIANYSFRGCLSLVSITLPVALATIGIAAFEGCTNLSGITLNSEATIGNNAFRGCAFLNRGRPSCHHRHFLPRWLPLFCPHHPLDHM